MSKVEQPPAGSQQKQLISTPAEPEQRILRLCELEAGQNGDCFVLLAGRDRSKTRDGKPFYRVQFRDDGRTVTTMVWADGIFFADCEQNWQIGSFYKVRGRYHENQYGSQFDLEKIRPVEAADREQGFDPDRYYKSTRFDAERMFRELVALAESEISDVPLRSLVVGVLEDHAGMIRQMAAAMNHHHAFRGGFVEHVLSVVKTAVFLADKYADYYPDMKPPLSKSVVVAGAVLHDIGKIFELDHQPQGATYTAQGRLIGHILLGRDLIREKARSIPDLDPELLLRLEHVIVSHHNLPEWGSPIPPHTPEALLVAVADDLDAKFHMMAAALEQEPSDGEEFTTRDNPLRRSIFRRLHG